MKPNAFPLRSGMLDTGHNRPSLGSHWCGLVSTLRQGCINLELMANKGSIAVQAASRRRSESLGLLDRWGARLLFRITSSTIIPQLTQRQP